MKEPPILSIFVALFGVLMLIVYIIFRLELHHAAAQGIHLEGNYGWLQFIGWLGIVVLIMGIALIVADRRGKGGKN